MAVVRSPQGGLGVVGAGGPDRDEAGVRARDHRNHVAVREVEVVEPGGIELVPVGAAVIGLRQDECEVVVAAVALDAQRGEHLVTDDRSSGDTLERVLAGWEHVLTEPLPGFAVTRAPGRGHGDGRRQLAVLRFLVGRYVVGRRRDILVAEHDEAVLGGDDRVEEPGGESAGLDPLPLLAVVRPPQERGERGLVLVGLERAGAGGQDEPVAGGDAGEARALPGDFPADEPRSLERVPSSAVGGAEHRTVPGDHDGALPPGGDPGDGLVLVGVDRNLSDRDAGGSPVVGPARRDRDQQWKCRDCDQDPPLHGR